ncbi:MAG: hypothetical protein AMXMBFR67_22570 [Nitrospira sp.]
MEGSGGLKPLEERLRQLDDGIVIDVRPLFKWSEWGCCCVLSYVVVKHIPISFPGSDRSRPKEVAQKGSVLWTGGHPAADAITSAQGGKELQAYWIAKARSRSTRVQARPRKQRQESSVCRHLKSLDGKASAPCHFSKDS